MIGKLFVISIGWNVITWVAYLQRMKDHEAIIDKHLQLAYHMNNTLLQHGIEPTELAMQTLREFGIREDNA